MSNENPSLAMFAQFAAVARALGHPHRLALMQLMAQGECAVETLAERSGLTVANASQHLQRLRRAGLAAARKDGQRVYYRIAGDSVLSLLADLRHIAERNLAEARQLVQTYFERRDSLEPVTRRELRRLMRVGGVTVLDVRSPEEFAAGHLPGAANIPVRELERRLKSLPPSQRVVAYCRGPYCIFSYEAVALLREHGYDARRLEDGFPEWRAARMPVESGGGAARAARKR